MNNDKPNLITPNTARPPEPAEPTEPPVVPATPKTGSKRANKWLVICSAVILLVGASACVWWMRQPAKAPVTVNFRHTNPKSSSAKVQGLQLDSSKNYGNKYANGILPVGDSKYSTASAAVGTPYVCGDYAKNLAANDGGAMTRGPWFTNNNTQYDITKKLHVQGAVTWQASFSNKVSGGTRTIVTNDLPNHTTGVFPISATDPAYAYDRNPNHIEGQTFTYALSASPNYGSPKCMGGQVGVMLTGVALFSAFDAGGRDAGAWEVQDSCSGHPQSDGVYHYHTLSSCIKDTSVKTVIGFALDGFPITGPQVGTNNILTTSDLDACHGLSSQIVLDGKNVTSYHYVMTEDFPYSVSCYRGTAITPPGQPSGNTQHP